MRSRGAPLVRHTGALTVRPPTGSLARTTVPSEAELELLGSFASHEGQTIAACTD
jgi:hypothetical protein